MKQEMIEQLQTLYIDIHLSFDDEQKEKNAKAISWLMENAFPKKYLKRWQEQPNVSFVFSLRHWFQLWLVEHPEATAIEIVAEELQISEGKVKALVDRHRGNWPYSQCLVDLYKGEAQQLMQKYGVLTKGNHKKL